MLEPGPERMRRLRYAGEKHVEDAMMIPATLAALLTVAQAAEGLQWVLCGSLAASCWMESRATEVIEVLVADDSARDHLMARMKPLPSPYSAVVSTAYDAGVSSEEVKVWYHQARRDQVAGVRVHVPRPQDIFLLFLADRDVINAPAAMYLACRLFQIQGPWDLQGVDLSPYQCERLAEAAALIIHHVAEKLERLEKKLSCTI